MTDPDASAPRAIVDLTPRQVARAIARDPRLILGVATLDPLGDDLPLGGGIRIVDEVVRRVSADLGILHAPTFGYGGVTSAGKERAGAAGLQRKTLHRAVNDLLGAWEGHGVREFVVVTAQRSEPHMDALLMAFTSEARTTVFDLLSLDISDLEGASSHDRPGEVEAAVLEHLGAGRRYSGDPEATPSASEANEGAAILERWVAAIVDTLGPAGPPPSDDV